MKIISKLNRGSELIKHLVAAMIILVSLLILPNARAAIGSTFTKDQLKYTVYTEDKETKTGTVSVEAESKGISGDIVIPESVENGEYTYSVMILPDDAFDGCSSLISIIISDSVTDIGNTAFRGCSSLMSIVIPDSITSIGRGAFYACNSLTNIAIPDSVTSIGSESFGFCKSLTSITIPDGVTSIEYRTFYNCNSLSNVVILGSVVFIRYGAFERCNSLTSITIPDSVTAIDDSAFSNCSSLIEIKIPDSVTSIGDGAFYNCSSLTSVTIPKGVTFINTSTFYGCGSLKSVYFKGDAPIINFTPFHTPSIIYYRLGTTGWTNPWSGRPTTLWIEAPLIEEQPQSQKVLEGDSVTFTVSAEGTAPLSYQWYKNDIAIEGATEETYTIESVTAEDLGNYKAVVTNTEGEAVSNIAVLSLLQPPTITLNPISVTVDNGTNVVFTVEALNADSYQWYKDGTAISGATETTYSIDYVKGSDVGTYTVMAINRAGEEKSSPAILSLTQPYRATAELQVVNGFIVGVTVTDCGWGYEFEPKVRFKDEFGEGAEAHCVVEGGMVTAIILDNPGSGYSEETTVKVGSPFKYVGMKAEVKQIKLTLYLVLGETYQLEACTDLSTHDWKRIGDPFIADEEETEVIVEVLETGRYFRVHEVK